MTDRSARNRWLAWTALAMLAGLSAFAFRRIDGLHIAQAVHPLAIGTLAGLLLAGWCLTKSRQPLGAWALAVMVIFVLFSRNATAMLGLTIFVVSCLSLGHVLGKWWKWPDGGGADTEEVSWLQIGLWFFLGLGVNAYAIWIAMHFSVNYPLPYFIVLGAEILLAREWLWTVGSQLWKQDVARPQSAGQTLILLWTLVYLPYTLVPFYIWDELGVHLYIPKVVSLYGQFAYDAKFPEGFGHSIIPKSAYTALFLMGGEIAVRLFNFLLFPAAFWILEYFSRRRWGRVVAFWSTLAAISTPFFIWQFGTVLIDSFALFSGTLLVLYTLHLADHFSGKNILMYFAVGALAYLSKQMAVYLLVPTGAWGCWLLLKDFRKTREFTRVGSALAGSAIFLLALVPLVIASQRALGYGNLFFLDGLMQRLFHLPIASGFVLDCRWAYPFSWRFPFDLTFNGLRFTEVGRFSFGLSYFVFGLFIPLVFMNRKLRKDALILVLLCAGAGVIWLKLNGAYIRYFSGIVPVGAVLLGMTLTELFNTFRPNRLLVRGGQVCAGLVFFLNFGLQLTFEGVVQPYPLVTALTDDHRASTSRYMQQESRVFKYAGMKYGLNAKCLAPGIKPMLYYAEFHIEGFPYYSQLDATIFNKASTADELFALIFLKEKFSFIISPTPSGKPMLDSPEFMSLVTREWKCAGYNLYTPKPEVMQRLRGS